MPAILSQPVVNIPISIEQGDTPSWVDYPFADDDGNTYDASTYALTYTLAGATAPISVSGVVTGTGWTTSLTAAQSAALSPGRYWWQAVLTKTGFALTFARGELTVIANLANQVAGYSGASLAEQNLANLQAQLAGITATENYKIATREMKFRLTKDLLDGISYWNAVVTSEQTKNSISQNQGNPRKMYARFPSRFGSNF